jgi:nitroreductase
MEFTEALKSRRSIRKFQDKPVPPEVLQQVLEAVQWSPSWANTQCWEVVVVNDPAIREELQAVMGKGNPATKAIVAAPVLLAMCGKLGSSGFYNGAVTTKFGDWFMFDLGIASQSLCLAARDLGLGSVIVGLFDQNQCNEILGLPDGYEVVSLIPLGYPAQEVKPSKRREIADFTHNDKF